MGLLVFYVPSEVADRTVSRLVRKMLPSSDTPQLDVYALVSSFSFAERPESPRHSPTGLPTQCPPVISRDRRL